MTAAPHIATAQREEHPGKGPGRGGVGLWGLTALTAFALGGLAAMELVHHQLMTIMARLVTAAAQAEILNVLDHLLPYRLGYVVLSLLLVLGTAGAFVWDALAKTLRSQAAVQR